MCWSGNKVVLHTACVAGASTSLNFCSFLCTLVADEVVSRSFQSSVFLLQSKHTFGRLSGDYVLEYTVVCSLSVLALWPVQDVPCLFNFANWDKLDEPLQEQAVIHLLNSNIECSICSAALSCDRGCFRFSIYIVTDVLLTSSTQYLIITTTIHTFFP